MLYTSLNNPKIKDLKKLKQKKYRDQTGLFLVEGEHLVEEARKAGYLEEVLLIEGAHYETDAYGVNVPTSYVSLEIMRELSSLDTPYKVMGVCKKKDAGVISGNVLILDDVQDPGNIGTIIRSAVAFNIGTIILSPRCADIYSSKVIRASQGMIFHINIVVSDVLKMINELKGMDYKILGTKVNFSKSLKNVSKPKKFVIIMGNEGNGVSKDVLNMCDDYIYIEMNKACESLNVAVATSIILYEMSR